MKRTGIVIVALVAAVALAGCKRDSGSPPPAAGPTTPASASPSVSASPGGAPSASASAGLVLEFTVDGAGPYQLGATLTALQANPGLAEVKKGGETCAQNTTARGTGVWKDVHLSFRPGGELYLAVNRSTAIPTPSGAWVGSTLAELKTIYKNVSNKELAAGTSKAFLVTTLSGRGILFDLDAKGKVFAMIAGEADYLESSYKGGTDFC